MQVLTSIIIAALFAAISRAESGWCSEGVLGTGSNSDKCCASECGTCGGSGCGSRPGGSSKCCTSKITETCVYGTSTACVVPENTAPAPVAVPTAATPVAVPTAAAPVAVPTAAAPVAVPTAAAPVAVPTAAAPVAVPTAAAPVAVPTTSVVLDWCSEGVLGTGSNSDKCCASECGTCGGSGCGSRPGGSSRCCTSKMTETCVYGSSIGCVVPENTGPAPEKDPVEAELRQCFIDNGANMKMLAHSETPGEDMLVFKNDNRYNFWRRGTNRRSEAYYPLVVVVAQEKKDVQVAVKCARQFEVPINLKSGGHSYEIGYVTKGILIDSSDMNRVIASGLNENENWIHVESGMKNARFAGSVIQESDKSGLGRIWAFTAGTWNDVGISGHALCGGYGTFGRLMGYLGDQISGMEIVTADGELMWLDENNNRERFRAIRSACSTALGIVVSLKFELYRMTHGQVITKCKFDVTKGKEAEIMNWAISYGPEKADERIAILYNTAKENAGGNFMGTKEQAIEALWTDEGYKEAARRLGKSTSSPPSGWFKEINIGEYWIDAYKGNTVEDLLSIKRRQYDGGAYYLGNVHFTKTIPVDEIQKILIDGSEGRAYAMKCRGGRPGSTLGQGVSADPYHIPELGYHARGTAWEVHVGSGDPELLNALLHQLDKYKDGNTGYIGYPYFARPDSGELGNMPWGDLYYMESGRKLYQAMRQELDPTNVFGNRFAAKLYPVPKDEIWDDGDYGIKPI